MISWEAGDDLARCLDALAAAADGLALQAIVVDNGSTDNTGEVLEQRPWVEAIRNRRNEGITKGRNQAVARTMGRMVVMLDADTIPRPGSIATMIRYLDEHPQVGLVGPRMLNKDGSLQLSCRRKPSPFMPFMFRRPLSKWSRLDGARAHFEMRDFDYDEARAVHYVLGACQCYRASLLDEIGPYDERVFSMAEDIDWCLRVWEAGYEVRYVPDAEVVHAYRHFTRSRPFSKYGRKALPDFFRVVWKHRRMPRDEVPGVGTDR
jgi:GT2 family glycosyltransferase